MFDSCIKKQNEIIALFKACTSEDEKYQKIIELGREQPVLDAAYKIPENIVKGCQSTTYLLSRLNDGFVLFQAESDALISLGLAALLIKVYSGESPITILKCPPTYLEELGVRTMLTPNRANGLFSIHLRMKQDALRLLLELEKQK